MSSCEVTSVTTKEGLTYSISVLSPPGKIITPDGFPSRTSSGAPKLFLDAMSIRYEVFCNEQGVAVDNEIDEDDPRSWHWVMYQTNTTSGLSAESPIPVCVLRIVPPPHNPHSNGFHDPKEAPYVKLGRVATLKQYRGRGLSVLLCDAVWKWLAENPGNIASDWKGFVLTHAQIYVEKLYIKQGFKTDEKLGQWDEEGIMHLGMWKRIDIKS